MDGGEPWAFLIIRARVKRVCSGWGKLRCSHVNTVAEHKEEGSAGGWATPQTSPLVSV